MNPTDIPFYSNTADDLHCLHACLRSALQTLYPHKNFTFEELEHLTGFEPNKLTWPMRAYVAVANLGYSVVVFDSMDFDAFVKSPTAYMEQAFGRQAAAIYAEKSNIETAVRDARALVSHPKIDLRMEVPSWSDLAQIIQAGMLAICHADQGVLEGVECQRDHSVLVHTITDDGVVVHDPGLPPFENKYISRDLFEKAWDFPSSAAKTIFAIGPVVQIDP